jgi:2-polyprenyl-6-methoxyphenol hydroxylase-like FAD-dependent oxidoreductase
MWSSNSEIPVRGEATEPLAIVGGGYVGLVTATCLAAAGRRVTLVEINAQRR